MNVEEFMESLVGECMNAPTLYRIDYFNTVQRSLAVIKGDYPLRYQEVRIIDNSTICSVNVEEWDCTKTIQETVTG